MFIPDMPNMPPQDRPVVAAQVGAADAVPNRMLGLCKGVPASLAHQGIPYSLGPLGNAEQYFKWYESRDITIPPITQVTVITAPKHGQYVMTPSTTVGGYASYSYMPDPGYLGGDSLTLKVELGDKSVTLKYFFKIGAVSDDAANSLCKGMGLHWKIATISDSSQGINRV